eukprot:6492268-Amphidinium_carterae.4
MFLCVREGTAASKTGSAFMQHNGTVPLSATVLGAPAARDLSLKDLARAAAKKLVHKHVQILQTESADTRGRAQRVVEFCKHQSGGQVVPFLDRSQQMHDLGQWCPLPAPCDMVALTCDVKQACSESSASLRELDTRWRTRHEGKRKVPVTRLKGVRPSTCLAEGCCHCRFSGRNKQSVASARATVKRAIQQICPGKVGQEQLQGGEIVLVWTARDASGQTQHVVVYVANYNLNPWRPTFLHLEVATESVSDFSACFLPESTRDGPERADDLYFTFAVAHRGTEPDFEGFMPFLLQLSNSQWFLHALHLSARTTPFLNARPRGLVRARLPKGGEQAEVSVRVIDVPIPDIYSDEDGGSQDKEGDDGASPDLEQYEAEEKEELEQPYQGLEPTAGHDVADRGHGRVKKVAS